MTADSGTNGGPSGSSDPAVSADGDRPRQRGVRAALVSLTPPEPSAAFWDRLEGALDDQDQLDIVTRPAVRSITEPPPISQPTLDDDPRHGLAAYRPSSALRPEVRRSRRLDDDDARRRRFVVIGVVAAVLAGLGGASVLGGGDDAAPPVFTNTTAAPGLPPGQTTAPAPTAVPGLDSAAPLTAAGIGPVATGMTLGELEGLGATFNIEQSTYDASGATCFDVALPGAADLTLRFRSPEAMVPVSSPQEGILASINIDAGVGSGRLTDVGIGLGATEEHVRSAYDDLEVSDTPARPGGHVLLQRADDGSGMAIAFVTDGSHVTEISVGEVEVIRLRQTCG